MTVENFTKEDRDLLIRLDERLKSIQLDFKEIHERIEKQNIQIKEEYVTQQEFIPVKNAVYSAIGFLLTSMVSMIVYLLFQIRVPR